MQTETSLLYQNSNSNFMIQRIQTVYLLMAALCSGCALFFPFFTGDTIPNVPIFADGVYNTQDHVSLMGVATVAILDALMTVFLYKNRKQQALLSLFVAVANIAFIAIMLVLLNSQMNFVDAIHKLHLGMGAIMPVLSVVFAIMARRSIVADDRLVRSMDRLR